MMHHAASWRTRARCASLVLAISASPLIWAAGSQAQTVIRSPNLSISPRVPSLNGSAIISSDEGRRPRPDIPPTLPRIGPTLPYDISTPNLDAACSNGGCGAVAGDSGGAGKGGGKTAGPRRTATRQAALNPRTIANEIVVEFAVSDRQVDEIARRHGLRRLASETFPLIDASIGLFRITDGRSVQAASRDFAREAGVRVVQPNYRYMLQEAAPSEGDPAQYAVAKLHLPEAHMLAHGAHIRIAVIDSGIDADHRELANSIVDSFDVIGSKEGPHLHGTGIAGAIAAHGRLIGSAPAAEIVAIRAFGKGAVGVESNSYVVLKSLDYAATHGARIVNMSFAGPKDPMIERGIDALASRGIVMIAAAGNAGAKSPPLYPAANPHVIAVSATDAQDHLFSASNRGGYIAVAAPGVDIFVPAPEQKYQMTSGTSFSAAYVSGVAALMLERNPALKPEDLRAILTRTARDLGSPGRDDQFGAGEVDANAAARAAAAAAPVAAAPSQGGEGLNKQQQAPIGRSIDPSVAAATSEKMTPIAPIQPATQ